MRNREAKKTERLGEQEKEGGGGGRDEQGRQEEGSVQIEGLSAAEYLTAEKHFDTLDPYYHPITKIPHEVKHCNTSSTGNKHYITHVT